MNYKSKELMRTLSKYQEPLVLILVEQVGTDKVAVYAKSVPLRGELKGFYRLKRILFQKGLKGLAHKINGILKAHRFNANPSYEIHFENDIFKFMPETLDRYKPVGKLKKQIIIQELLELGASNFKIYR